MEVSIIKMPNGTSKWSLVDGFFKLHKRLHGGSRLIPHPHYDALPIAHYVVAHRQGQVVAGARLLQCDTVSSVHLPGHSELSYMIRDASLGRIDLGMSPLTGSAPTSADTWEISCLAAADPEHAVKVIQTARGYLRILGAQKLLCLAAPGIMDLACKRGLKPEDEGSVCSASGQQLVVFSCLVQASDGDIKQLDMSERRFPVPVQDFID